VLERRRRRLSARWPAASVVAIATIYLFAVFFCGVAALSNLAHLPRLRRLPTKLVGHAAARLEWGEFDRLLLRAHGRLSFLRCICVIWMLIVLILLVMLVMLVME
jgi:hypothetical protein